MGDQRLKRFGQLIYFVNTKIDEITGIELADYNVSREQIYMLELIKNEDNMTQKKLIFKMSKEQTAVSRSIKKLAEYGYITKEQSMYDLRSTVLKLTPQGQEIVDMADGIKAKVVRSFMKELNKKESEELINILEKIYHSFSIRDPFKF
ncbi:MarR family winged helix-turn-helix transcriptional regulator [Macrococcus bovicus]|uniref:MarR family transcriptional regulator n=1 Tax=Macrococcus bovicus TaxID=69968 RepID=A0A4R6C136_9STAP|nr:winged helix DNA-binding protein [Macrococcus bovicus]TDM14897.1 MarR family transcriptional regulator [Macrococcus bovicus]WJP98469.1 winged helix DNA-binding protein [Macrococcus bovicus]